MPLSGIPSYKDGEVCVCVGSGAIHACGNPRGVPCALSKYHATLCMHVCWASWATVADDVCRSEYIESQAQSSFFDVVRAPAQERASPAETVWPVRRLLRKSSDEVAHEQYVAAVCPVPPELRASDHHATNRQRSLDVLSDEKKKAKERIEAACLEVTELLLRGRIRAAFDDSERKKAETRTWKAPPPTSFVDFVSMAVEHDAAVHYMDVGPLHVPHQTRTVDTSLVAKYAQESAEMYAAISSLPIFNRVHYAVLPHAIEYLYARATGVLAGGCMGWTLPPAPELAILLPAHDVVARFSAAWPAQMSMTARVLTVHARGLASFLAATDRNTVDAIIQPKRRKHALARAVSPPSSRAATVQQGV